MNFFVECAIIEKLNGKFRVILISGDEIMYNQMLKFYNFEEINTNDEENSGSKDSFDSLQDYDGSVTVEKNGKYIHCLTIIGQIEGHYTSSSNVKTTKYEHIIPRLVAVEENDDISGLLVILNTIGGDIEAGLAISELIAGMKKPTASLVLGGSHSIGIPLAVSTKKSFIVPTASMTVHPVRMNGLVLGVPQTLLYLQKMEDRVLNFITRNSNISSERFKELMLNTKELVSDFGTVLDGKQAVQEGVIDEIGSLCDALEYLGKFN